MRTYENIRTRGVVTKKENKILTLNFEKYTQFNPVFKHDIVNANELKKVLSKAYKEYYFRP